MNTIKEKAQNLQGKFMTKVMLPAATFMTTVAAASVVPAFAADELSDQADSFVQNLVNVIALFGKYLGIVLGAWGVIQLALGFKNEDADSKSRALMLIIAAIILFNVETLINMLGLNV